MGDQFANGGTNSVTQTYNSGGSVNGNSNNTLTNTSTGRLLFVPPAAQSVNIYGNLTNSGDVSYIPSTAGGGSSFYLGGSSNVLQQTGGTITFKQLDATSGPSVYLQYGTISNDTTGTIDLEAAGAATISAPYVSNLTNAGTIKVLDTSGTGMTSNWGNGTGAFNNTGSFSIDNSAATSGSTTNLNFNGISNNGTVSLDVPAASTSLTNVGTKGFTNNGTWSVASHGNGGGNIQIYGGTSIYTNNGTINVSDANLSIANALTGTDGVVNLSNGANVTLNSNNSGYGQTFNFSGGNNTLDISNGQSFTGVIRGFSQGDKLDLNVSGTPSYDKTTGLLTITNGTNVYTYDIGKNYTGTFSGSGGVFTYTGTTPCYLSGSMIRTPTGDKAVEDLVVGDELVIWDSATASETVETVVWIGTKNITPQPHLSDDLAGYPVRILKDAISDGIPYKDMLITAEHCLYFNGKFVPARMLVNGRSVFYDRQQSRFNVYHVETQKHSVLFADGMRSESFLNTDNHEKFRQHGKVVSITPRSTLTWEGDAAVPLDTSRPFVEPIFHQIKARAELAGGVLQVEASPLTQEASLHLITEGGAVIHPVRVINDRVMFMLPTGVNLVHVVSNTSRPSEVIGPFVDDRRQLGVLVGTVTLFESEKTRTITSYLHESDLDGWNNVEDGTTRWTAGHAELRLGERQPNSMAILSLEIRASGPYLSKNTDHFISLTA